MVFFLPSSLRPGSPTMPDPPLVFKGCFVSVTLTFRRLGRSEWIASPAYGITEGDVTGIDFHLHALTTWPATVHASKA